VRSRGKRRAGPPGRGCAIVVLAAALLAGEASAAAMRYLDPRHPALSRRLDAQARDGGARERFVRIRIVEVRNPRRTGLTFDVDFRADDGLAAHLGSFSLYPADNPGTFIVPFPRRATSPGTVVLTFHATDRIDPAAPPVIGVGAIDLVEPHGF
jgi:hypothetical protein